jgi:hypothetical protein
MSQLVRDTGTRSVRLLWGAILTALAVGCGVFTPSWGFAGGMGAIVFGVAGISVIAAAFAFAGRGPCPSCNREMLAVPRDSDGVACSACGAYAQVRAAVMHPTPADAVASTPVYGVTVAPGTQPAFPAMCVGCGQPATVSRPWNLTKTVIGAPGVGRIVDKWTIAVPLCAQHGQLNKLGLPTGITSYQGKVQLQSHRAWLLTTGRS